MSSMLSGLITSKIRINILMRLFLNPDSHAYLRELSADFGASPSHVRDELRQLSEAGILIHEKTGRQINYRASQTHPLFNELHSIVKKAMGMDKILDSIIERLGNLDAAYLLDDYAEGKDSGVIDLLLVGNIDQKNLLDLKTKTEKYIGRKIRTLCLTTDELGTFREISVKRPMLELWRK